MAQLQSWFAVKKVKLHLLFCAFVLVTCTYSMHSDQRGSNKIITQEPIPNKAFNLLPKILTIRKDWTHDWSWTARIQIVLCRISYEKLVVSICSKLGNAYFTSTSEWDALTDQWRDYSNLWSFTLFFKTQTHGLGVGARLLLTITCDLACILIDRSRYWSSLFRHDIHFL